MLSYGTIKKIEILNYETHVGFIDLALDDGGEVFVVDALIVVAVPLRQLRQVHHEQLLKNKHVKVINKNKMTFA